MDYFDNDDIGVNITTAIRTMTWTESSLSLCEGEEEEGWSFKPCLDATMVTSSVSTSTTSNKASRLPSDEVDRDDGDTESFKSMAIAATDRIPNLLNMQQRASLRTATALPA